MIEITDDFVAAMLSSATNTKIITSEDFSKMNDNERQRIESVDISDLHRSLLMHGVVSIVAEGTKDIIIFIKTLIGDQISIEIPPDQSVSHLKDLISIKKMIPQDTQRLIFAGEQLEDWKRLNDYDIKEKCTVLLVQRLRGGDDIMDMVNGKVLVLKDVHKKKFDLDLTNVKNESLKFIRGGLDYKRPIGTYRMALNVLNKYENNEWLGVPGKSCRTSNVPGEWAVSYHGTGHYNAKSISESGYQLTRGKRFRHGRGIYSTPDFKAALDYAKKYKYKGQWYKMVIQNRVNPKTVIRIPASETRDGDGEYWISEKEDDIRPYGFCFKKC